MKLYPLVRFTLCYATGILFASFFSFAFFLLVFAIVCLIFGITRRAFWGFVALNCAFCALGVLRITLESHIMDTDVVHFATKFVHLRGIVRSDVEMPNLSQTDTRGFSAASLLVEAEQIETNADTSVVPATGYVRVFLALASSNNKEGERAGQPLTVSLPRYGDNVVVQGILNLPEPRRNPEGFDDRERLRRRGIYSVLRTKWREDWEFMPRPSFGVMRPLLDLRRRFVQHVQKQFAPEEAAVLNGILFGSRSDLSGAARDAFERTGTAHILATAGLHVGMLAGILFGFWKLFRLSRRTACALTLITLVGYAVLAEGRPPVVRAVTVASVYLLGILLEREANWGNATAFAALILLLWQPHSLFEPGFQLSFATVITIVLLMPTARRGLEAIQKRFAGETVGMRAARFTTTYFLLCFFLTLFAQIGAFPLLVTYFHITSFTSLPANLMAVPLVSPILALGFLSNGLALVHPSLAMPINWVLHKVLSLLIEIVQEWARLEEGVSYWASPPFMFVVIYYMLLWGTAWFLENRLAQRRKNRKKEVGG